MHLLDNLNIINNDSFHSEMLFLVRSHLLYLRTVQVVVRERDQLLMHVFYDKRNENHRAAFALG